MISHKHIEIYKKIHAETPFGKRSKFPKHLENFILKTKPKSILDFGCGKGRLINKIKEIFPDIDVSGYDPANPEFNESLDNKKFDMIISSDVLEHVEPEFINETLQYLKTRSRYFYHLIACSPAKLILPDGRNAHLIIENQLWWRSKFSNHNYKIVKEDWQEFEKIPKGTKHKMLVRKYFIIGETDGQP
jgi:2-polyprenyl-3-methyl-5-hydroxy-6-metoxy-1,4-benzoquinol methylase